MANLYQKVATRTLVVTYTPRLIWKNISEGRRDIPVAAPALVQYSDMAVGVR